MFAKRLKALRQEKDVLQKDVAVFLGITTSAYGFYEQGKRQPDQDTLQKLADFFHVSVDYLLGRTDATPEQKIESALTDDPELADFWQELSKRDDLQLLFKQVRPLSPASIKKIIRIIKAIEDEEAENINGG